MDRRDELTVGELAGRAGLSTATVRFYEDLGLVQSRRTPGNQRRYPRHTLRRLALVRAGQRFGLSLELIGEALAVLPHDRPPTKADWRRLSTRWHAMLSEQIATLTAVRDGLTSCIGCGCLSLRSCPVYNPHDELAEHGPGAQRWPRAAR